MLINKHLKSADFFESLSAVIKLALIFLIGVGSYRSVLFLILFYCIMALFDYQHKYNVLKLLFLPLFLCTLYYDFKYGQLFFRYDYNLVLFIIFFVIIDKYTTKYINTLIEKISNHSVFSYCSNCKFENNKLTNKCNNCGFEDGLKLNIMNNKHKVYDDSFYLQLPGLNHKLKQNTIDNLLMDEDEFIYMSIKIKLGNSPYIDDNKKLCKSIVITNKNIIFLNELYCQRGWRWREKTCLMSIEKIDAINKKISISTRQAIKLCAGSRTFEIFLWSMNKQEDIFYKYFCSINTHIEKMQRINEEIYNINKS